VRAALDCGFVEPAAMLHEAVVARCGRQALERLHDLGRVGRRDRSLNDFAPIAQHEATRAVGPRRCLRPGRPGRRRRLVPVRDSWHGGSLLRSDDPDGVEYAPRV
jgi:hypothetical protein